MFRSIKEASAGIKAVDESVRGLTEAVHALLGNIPVGGHADPEYESRLARLVDRIAELEQRVDMHYAEAESLLVKAKGKLDGARAAEERTRRLAERSEESDDEIEARIRAAYEDAGIQLEHEHVGQEEGVQPVRNGLAPRDEDRQSAYAMKWGSG